MQKVEQPPQHHTKQIHQNCQDSQQRTLYVDKIINSQRCNTYKHIDSISKISKYVKQTVKSEEINSSIIRQFSHKQNCKKEPN